MKFLKERKRKKMFFLKPTKNEFYEVQFLILNNYVFSIRRTQNHQNISFYHRRIINNLFNQLFIYNLKNKKK